MFTSGASAMLLGIAPCSVVFYGVVSFKKKRNFHLGEGCNITLCHSHPLFNTSSQEVSPLSFPFWPANHMSDLARSPAFLPEHSERNETEESGVFFPKKPRNLRRVNISLFPSPQFFPCPCPRKRVAILRSRGTPVSRTPLLHLEDPEVNLGDPGTVSFLSFIF